MPGLLSLSLSTIVSTIQPVEHVSPRERKKFGSLAEKKQRLHIFLLDTAKTSAFESVQTALFIYTSIMIVKVNLTYLQKISKLGLCCLLR